MKKETKAIHSGQGIDQSSSAINFPIYLSTTFERDVDGTYPNEHIYSRYSNPNRVALEQCLADLEGGVACACFSSGSAAMMTLLQTLVPGDHVIAPDIIYFGISELMKKIFAPLGIDFDFVDMSDLENVRNHIMSNTKLVIAETPSNPQITLTDIKSLAAITHEAGALLVVDNTIATPVFQSPIELGADMVIHATTKYIAGHSDVLGGAVITADENERWEKIVYIQRMGGAVPSPFECWLALRGIQTMTHRVRAMADTAMTIAKQLSNHPAVEEVLYPGLESSPSHALAKQQMKGFGALMSILIKGDDTTAIAVTNKLKLITRATSFGGTHSLIEHRASIEAEGSLTPKNLLRFSVGLEHVDDLIEDLLQALG
jgi:cystathionine gamma-synthase